MRCSFIIINPLFKLKTQQIKFFSLLKSAWLVVKKMPFNIAEKDFANALKEVRSGLRLFFIL